MKSSKALWCAVLCLTLATSAKADIAASIALALVANASSISYTEWSESGRTPEEIFRDTQQLDTRQAWTELCNELSKLQPDDLTLFEHEINDPAFAKNLTCRTKLNSKLRLYWANSANKLAAQHGHDFLDLAVEGAQKLPTLPSEERLIDTSEGPVLFDGGLKPGEIALTFDDGPHPTRTMRVLRILKEAGVRATFFEVGTMAKHYSPLSRMTLNEGHTVGSHSWNHRQLPKLTFAAAQKNIMAGHETVSMEAGIDSSFFRFPYGARSTALQNFVSEMGMATFFWNMDSLDWKLRNPTRLFQNVVQKLNRFKGGIMLFHDVQEQTVIALPHIIDELKKRNFKTVVFVPRKVK